MQYYAEKLSALRLDEAKRAQLNQAFVDDLSRARRRDGTTMLGRWKKRVPTWLHDARAGQPLEASAEPAAPTFGYWSW